MFLSSESSMKQDPATFTAWLIGCVVMVGAVGAGTDNPNLVAKLLADTGCLSRVFQPECLFS
jgi:hypothetical protein